MPEGPEVKITTDYLHEKLRGSTLLEVKVIGGKFHKTPPAGLDKVKFPLTFESVGCKGKMLIFTFRDTTLRIFAGLGMTGQFLFRPAPHSALEFRIDFSGTLASMYFVDMRRFGNVSFSTRDLSSELAPSILGGITEEEFFTRASALRTKRDVVSVLMDQKAVCSGIGNYLLAEILYAAEIDPFREFKNLSELEWELIRIAAVQIATRSYRFQGVTVSDFVAPDETEGKFQSQLQVYGRKLTPKGEKVVAEKGSHGRTIWWVPSVQRK
jgi:formamidopyrimidine-DNA glycosylase